ncbi:DUF4097 family beta strand repeat protein [Streptomyces sp. p1417]|uniref:DUF4097 family beta strand repeat protein n=1 Tax=Streptomyces typhae TaxID=2681492 RepID=A0A6L6X2A3_9ACTN|nr:DUF4097 family beta strand repeat-containing protein [Streptomyces typhae]MVO87978.1 DUF4097 family beta strand repeat protein [Streptomyces typhae]
MPSFDTPEPISAVIEFDMGTAHISASKRLDTVVTVTPSNGAEQADVKAAEQTEVSCKGGTLLIKGAKKRSLFGGKTGSVDVTIELPAGSDVRALTAVGAFTTEGRLGDCRLETASGDVRVAEADAAFLKTSLGDIRLDRATGDVEAEAAGRVELGDVAGAATVRNFKGDTTIREVTGELRATAAYGAVAVGVAHGAVDITADSGTIKVDEVIRGMVTLETSDGGVEVGIRRTSVAQLEVKSHAGTVHNSIDTAAAPGPDAESVTVRARTGVGDIVIRRNA